MSRRKPSAPNSEALIREKIFGPAPILKNENAAEYELLLARVYADVKPTDLAMEGWIHDYAYWSWEVRRWRRMKICVIETARDTATSWVLGGPRSQRFKFIGELNDLADVDVEKLGPLPSLISEEEYAIRLEEAKNDFKLVGDTITTRAFLEEFDRIELFDNMLAIAERNRNAAYREIHRHRAAIKYAEREKIRIIDQAEFKVIRSEKHRAKRKQQKNAT